MYAMGSLDYESLQCPSLATDHSSRNRLMQFQEPYNTTHISLGHRKHESMKNLFLCVLPSAHSERIQDCGSAENKFRGSCLREGLTQRNCK